MENDSDTAAIYSLPDEILIIVLKYTSTADIINFGNTCKQFNDLIKSSHSLWKNKLKNSVSKFVFDEIEKQTDGNWYNEVKRFAALRCEIYAGIVDMTSHYYKYENEITLEAVRKFFNNTFSNGLYYLYTIHILQELIRIVNNNLFVNIAKKPFTLTEMHYAKVVLCHLIHSYMAIKWVQAHVKNDMSPEFVLNFFLQWVDPLVMHTDEDVNEAIDMLADMVERGLQKTSSKDVNIRDMCLRGEITEPQILAAISHTIYKEKRMGIGYGMVLELLDIVKVINVGCGPEIVVAAIYQAVAARFGVRCELIAFPNHLFLEWRNSRDPTDKQTYKIDLFTGKLTPKRTCPFSRNTAPSSYKYCPDSLLQFTISTFLMHMGGTYRTPTKQYAVNLLDFLSTNPDTDNPYKNFLPYLLDHIHLPALSTPINVRCLTGEHLKIIVLLSYLNKAPEIARKPTVVNKRSSDIKYAVGMICYHRVYDYVCVIRGWERTCTPELLGRQEIRSLEFGARQPFYVVVAVDQSDRYVAQENLASVTTPSRLFHLEDIIAKEFTHFNGYAYVPNVHKQEEFPDDVAVSEQYRTRARSFCDRS